MTAPLCEKCEGRGVIVFCDSQDVYGRECSGCCAVECDCTSARPRPLDVCMACKGTGVELVGGMDDGGQSARELPCSECHGRRAV